VAFGGHATHGLNLYSGQSTEQHSGWFKPHCGQVHSDGYETPQVVAEVAPQLFPPVVHAAWQGLSSALASLGNKTTLTINIKTARKLFVTLLNVIGFSPFSFL
jgi:hypothetical protein